MFNRLIAIDEFHHVSSNPDNTLGSQLGTFIVPDKVHLVAMTGSYFRGGREAVLGPADEARLGTFSAFGMGPLPTSSMTLRPPGW